MNKKYIIHFRGIKVVWDQVIITGKFEPITLINFLCIGKIIHILNEIFYKNYSHEIFCEFILI